MQNCYPVIFIPEAIVSAQNALIPFPTVPTEPIKPAPPESNFGTGCLVFLLSFIFANLLPALGLIMFLVGTFTIISGFSDRTQYKTDLAKYNTAYSSYLNERYKCQKDIIEIKLKRQNANATNAFRQDLINKILKKTPISNRTHACITGKSEIYFLSFLEKYFGSKISTNKCIEIFQNGNAYVPDFIYTDQTGLHIDIEIDEPYTIGSNEPIHFIDEDGVSKDSDRDVYFLERGWVVIRFSEEQAVKFPNECCGIIADTISGITGKMLFKEKFDELPSREQWTFADSISMVQSKFREKYLSKLSADKMMEDGVGLYNADKYKEAIECFSNSINSYPDVNLYYYLRGRCYYFLDDFVNAILDFKKSISLGNKDYNMYNFLGVSLYESEKTEESIQYFSKSIDIKPSESTYLNRAMAFKELNKFEKAIEDIDKCIEIAPNDGNYYNIKAIINYNLGFYAKAIEDISRANTLIPNDKVLMLNSAHIKYYNGDLEDSLNEVKIILNQYSNDQKAITLFDRIDKTKSKLEIVINNNNFNLAWLYFKLGFNVTCIINEVNQYNQKSNNLLKTPSHPWRDSFSSRQKFFQIVDFDWSKSVGIGVLSGVNNIVVIDFDGCSDLEFIYKIIRLLELPSTYKWVVRSGSQNGFHIFIRSNRFEWMQNDDAAITRWPEKEYIHKFTKVELLYKTNVVVPPSMHSSGGKYEFIHSDFPSDPPAHISSNLLEEVISMISSVEEQKIGKSYFLALD